MRTHELFDAERHLPPIPLRPVAMLDALDIERVAASDVEYLCFEGGGGKGIIFLGAVKELEQRGILTYGRYRLDPAGKVKGIAGSSAGALTAVLLSCGYTSRFLEQMLLGDASTNNTPTFDFNRFFDLPTSGMPRPTPTGCQDTGWSMAWRALSAALTPVISTIAGGVAGVDAGSGAEAKIASRPVDYILNLIRHWGVFSGCAAHDLFDQLIARQAARVRGNPGDWQRYRNLSFANHAAIFGCKLVLTGSNFSTGKTGFFSAETTPNFPVAAAARISMSLPLIFKPMVVTAAMERQYRAGSSAERVMSEAEMRGVWVDGGYFNNLPQTAFRHLPNGFERTLGFSLLEFGGERRRITNFAEFVLAYANHGLFGGGESQISASTGIAPNVVPLVAGDRGFQIGTTQFAFRTDAEKQAVRRLIVAAERATERYFRPR